MPKIVIITGNPGKISEIKALSMGKLDFAMCSLDLEKIVKDKAEKAYAQIKEPVIVDDVSAGLASLKGLPGPFIKFFNQSLGSDALYQLAKAEDDIVTINCIAAYYDGKKFILGRGAIKGGLVTPRGSNGFGFDSVVVPEGQNKTMAEMTKDQKMKVSHRGKAFRSLLRQLEALK